MLFLHDRAAHAVEEMDLPGCDPDRLDATYAQFALVNRVVSGWRGIYRRRLRPRLRQGPATLLDIGCGGGDVPVMISRWAARDGLHLQITAIDPDPRASRFAAERHAASGVEFRRATAAELVSEGLSFDLVVSNHVLHHLTEAELPGFLAESAALCHGTAIHSDLRRNPAAYALFFAGSWPFTGSYIRQDGLTSIRRSYTTAELRATVPPGWTVEPRAPFRNELVRARSAGDAASNGTDTTHG